MLEDFGVVNRKVYTEIPRKVEYSISELGTDFAPVLDQFRIWGYKYIKALEKGTVKLEQNEE